MSLPSLHFDLENPRIALRAAGALVLAFMVLRIIALFFDPHSLYADETQYWLWSQSLDWGYFSKPPMIAWVIAVTTALFGDADWAVRLAAPILNAVTASFLGLTAARLFGARAGFWSAVMWTLMPAVWLGAFVIATDAVMLAGWSAGLYALVRLRERAEWRWAVMLGAAAGWAFLSKYATIYFLLGTAAAIIIDAPTRKALLTFKGLGAGALFLAIISGNLLWNAANDFATVSHTAANANWGGSLFHFDELTQFIGDQFGVFGPVMFPALCVAIFFAIREADWTTFTAARPRLMLAFFTAPALIIVTFQAFISRAHANWAASAYAAGTILVVAFLVQYWRVGRWVIYASLVIHVSVGSAFMILAANAPLSDQIGMANAFKRVREWPATIEAVEQVAREADVAALVYDNRNDFHQMQRYGSEDGLPVYMWMRYGGAHNFAEATWPLPAGYDSPVLIVSERPEEVPLIEGDFESVTPAGEVVIDLRDGRERRYTLLRAVGYNPVPRSAAFEADVAASRTDPQGD